jgi:hypothetical protein
MVYFAIFASVVIVNASTFYFTIETPRYCSDDMFKKGHSHPFSVLIGQLHSPTTLQAELLEDGKPNN